MLLLGRSAWSAAPADRRLPQPRRAQMLLGAGGRRSEVGQGRIDAPLAKQPGETARAHGGRRGRGPPRDHLVPDRRRAYKKAAWLELEPRTGRTHQLRAHCALLGTPIQGDSLYGGDVEMLSGGGISKKLHLHARAIRLPIPRAGTLQVEAPLPRAYGFEFRFLRLRRGDGRAGLRRLRRGGSMTEWGRDDLRRFVGNVLDAFVAALDQKHGGKVVTVAEMREVARALEGSTVLDS